MAKIGPILSIIFPATSTEVQPAVLYKVPSNHLFDAYIIIIIFCFLGVSNITTNTYCGFDVGNIEAMYLSLLQNKILLLVDQQFLFCHQSHNLIRQQILQYLLQCLQFFLKPQQLGLKLLY